MSNDGPQKTQPLGIMELLGALHQSAFLQGRQAVQKEVFLKAFQESRLIPHKVHAGQAEQNAAASLKECNQTKGLILAMHKALEFALLMRILTT